MMRGKERKRKVMMRREEKQRLVYNTRKGNEKK